MKISKLLSKLYIILLTFCFLIQTSLATEPVDIWKINSEGIYQEGQVKDD